MADQFDFPQPLKRRRISTYATRRSTLDPNQQDIQANGHSGTLRKSSRSHKPGTDSKNHSAGLDKNETTLEGSSDLPVLSSRSSHKVDSNTAVITNTGFATKRRQPSRTILHKTEPTGSPRRSYQHEEVSELEDKNIEVVTLDQESTPPPPVGPDVENEHNPTVIVQPRSSGRERKRPRRYSISPEKPKSKLVKTTEPPFVAREKTQNGEISPEKHLKGILTPSRRGEKRGPRKSVVFDQEEKEIEQHFGFKDIGSSVKSTQGTPSQAELPSPLKKTKVGKKHGQSSTTQETHDTGLSEAVDDQVEEEDILIDQIIERQKVAYEPVPNEVPIKIPQPIDNDPSLLAIKAAILTRLVNYKTTGTSISSHLQSQYTTVYNLLTATITAGESNSLLLLGSRGSGKSHLVAHALADLNTKYRSEFHIVHLNGFFQTDDRIALREIWRQLGREMKVNENETDEVSGSYADTMASLLSLLSHPEDFEESNQVDESIQSTSQNAHTVSKSIVFVLDEFDLFTTHPRQTLLYNLFDIAQSRKAPIAVIGCSTRMDVVDCLEKRVKSRFSHRWVHISSTKSLDGFQEILKRTLCLDEDTRLSKNEQTIRRSWNQHIESKFLPSSAIQALIKCTYHTSKSLPDLFAALYTPIATVQLPHNISPKDSEVSVEMTAAPTQPSMLTVLLTVSTLHLSLLIAAARLEAIHNLMTVNFNLVYDHYSELITRSKIQKTASGALAVGAGLRQWNRETAKRAWEDLSGWHVIVPATSGTSGKDGSGDTVGGEGASVRMCRLDVTLDDLNWTLKERSDGIADILGKWCREI